MISDCETYSFNGTVNNPCYFVRCNTVQEADGSGDRYSDGTGIVNIGDYGSDSFNKIKATFTRFSALGDRAVFIGGNGFTADSIYNCEFWNGAIGGDANDKQEVFNCYNCLFDRSAIDLSLTAASYYGGLILKNCTLHGGNLTLDDLSDPGSLDATSMIAPLMELR